MNEMDKIILNESKDPNLHLPHYTTNTSQMSPPSDIHAKNYGEKEGGRVRDPAPSLSPHSDKCLEPNSIRK